MYHARQAATKILRKVCEIEQIMKSKGLVYRLLQDDSRREALTSVKKTIFNDLTELLSKTLIEVNMFIRDNQLYKGDFLFNG